MEDSQQDLGGQYHFIRQIGQGTTGKVKLAFDKVNNRHVAVKIVKKSLFQNRPNLEVKIQREIALMRLVDHPHLLKLIDILESPRHLYIVTDYAVKGELFDYLVQHRFLPEDVAMNFFRQIIYGLEYLHSLGICHRDLKPENILLDENLNIKIADFGFARVVKSNIASTSCGSPHYAAPEVIKGEPYDGRAADVWSCGVILYALLAGFLPFDDPNIRVLLGKVKRGLYTMPQFPTRVKDLIRGMLTIDPTKRISIAQIKAHECFRGDINPEYVFPTPLPLSSYNIPIPTERITQEVIETLLKIGYPDADDLMEELTNPQPAISKIFFHLCTSRLALDQIDWSQSASGVASHNLTDNALIVEPANQAFQIVGSEMFHRHALLAQPASHRGEPMSYAKKAEWDLPEPENIEYEHVNNIDVTGMPLVYTMLAVQRTVRALGMQWFHPDDFTIICRHLDMGIYVSVQVNVVNDKALATTYLMEGTPETFTAFCTTLENEILDMKDLINEGTSDEEDSDDNDNQVIDEDNGFI